MIDYKYVFVDPFVYSWITWRIPFVANETDTAELRKQFFRRRKYEEVLKLLIGKSQYPEVYVRSVNCGGWLKSRDNKVKVSPGFLSPFLKNKHENCFKSSLFVMVRYNAYVFAALNRDLGFDVDMMYQYWLLHQTVTKTVASESNVLLVDSRVMLDTREIEIMGYRLSLKVPELEVPDNGLGSKLVTITNPWFDTKEI